MPTQHRSDLAMRLGAAILGLSLFIAATAEKPAISVKTKSAEITVTIDDALKADAGLYQSFLAEARREVAKWRAEAAESFNPKDMPFNIGERYTYSRSYEQRSVIGRYVSVLRTDSTFTGGAHPNSVTDTILWDRDAKKRISIRPFFKETANKGPTMTAMAKLVRAAVYVEKKRRNLDTIEGNPDTDTWLKDIEPSLLKLGPVTLAPSNEPNKSSGLTFHFSPYMVGPYAEGPLTAFVPWTAFRDSLSPEGVAVFGGTRPESDLPKLD